MPTKTIDFEIADLNLTQGDEDYPELAMSVDVDYDIHPAEPDVGIFGAQHDITEWTFSLNGESFSTVNAFAARLYNELETVIQDEPHEVLAAVTDWIDATEKGIDFDD